MLAPRLVFGPNRMCMRVLRFFVGGVEPRCWLFFPSPGFCYIRYTEVGQAPGLFRTPKAYPQPPLVHGRALAYFRGNLTDYAHAWTGMNHLPQAPQSSALPSCATARYPISMGQENVTGPSSLLTFGHNPPPKRHTCTQ